ncbi:MAG: hypothetical protein ACREKS_03595 [Candidatus Rokuibacteriota bacterium]
MRWAGERVYPFYIWHQTVIVVVLAFYLIRAEASPLAKFLILIPPALAITVALGEALSRVGRLEEGLRLVREAPALAWTGGPTS